MTMPVYFKVQVKRVLNDGIRIAPMDRNICYQIVKWLEQRGDLKVLGPVCHLRGLQAKRFRLDNIGWKEWLLDYGLPLHTKVVAWDLAKAYATTYVPYGSHPDYYLREGPGKRDGRLGDDWRRMSALHTSIFRDLYARLDYRTAHANHAASDSGLRPAAGLDHNSDQNPVVR